LFIAGALGATHAGRITLMVQDLSLVEDVMKVMAGQPDGATREEMGCHLNQDGGAPGSAAPWGRGPPHCQGASSHHSPHANDGSDSDSDDSDNPHPPACRRLYGGPGSTGWTRGSRITGECWGSC